MVSHYGKPTEITATKLCLFLFLFFLFLLPTCIAMGRGIRLKGGELGGVGDCSYVMQDTMSGRHTAHCGDEGFLTNML